MNRASMNLAELVQALGMYVEASRVRIKRRRERAANRRKKPALRNALRDAF